MKSMLEGAGNTDFTKCTCVSGTAYSVGCLVSGVARLEPSLDRQASILPKFDTPVAKDITPFLFIAAAAAAVGSPLDYWLGYRDR